MALAYIICIRRSFLFDLFMMSVNEIITLYLVEIYPNKYVFFLCESTYKTRVEKWYKSI